MSKNQQGNDQVIADFFKKSLVVIVGVSIVLLIIVFVKNIDSKKDLANEQTYQAPAQLDKNIEPPSTEFLEEAKQRGINFKHENGAIGNKMLPETMGSGVAFLDYDNDGDQDLIFANGTNWPWNEKINSIQHIYANDGKGYFTDVSKDLGFNNSLYGTGVAVGDVNSDGV